MIRRKIMKHKGLKMSVLSVVVLLFGLVVSPVVAATFTQITLPDAAYLASTTKIDISGLPYGSNHTAITDGTLTVSFSAPMQKRGPVPTGWNTWSSPPYSESPNPHVLWTQGASSLTMTLSQPVTTFGFELEPNPYTTVTYNVQFILMSGGTVIGTITIPVNGYGGARLFAASVTGGSFDQIVINGGRDFAIAQVRYISNAPPTADANGPYFGDEGSAIPLDGTASSDPDGDPLTYSWSVNSTLCTFDDATSATPNLTCTDNGNFTLTLVVDDGQATDSDTASVTVSNVAPSVGIDDVSPTLLAVGESVTANGSFTDPGTNDAHTAEWDWGDSSTSAGTINGLNVGPDSHTYAAPGIYTVKLTVTDDDGGVGMDVFEFVVVYDPDGGFVTGGGWMDSPEGAYKPDTSLTGKANFGFVSKYKKGATTPTGNTEFQFHAADLNFHSSSYQWLVVTGSDYARFKGSGTINGMGDYRFMLWAGDDAPDTFRIRIWEEDEFGAETDIYDNGFNQAIGGGSIVIHTKK
jgi:PKD repeat protein